MRLGSIVSVFFALVLAVTAGLLAQLWLEQQRRNGSGSTAQVAAPAKVGSIVVASQPLRFGMELNSTNLREIDWPTGSVPIGAFASIGELIKSGERRVVLSAIEPNEPILKAKVTGPGQRASLSAVIEPGKKAITIRVNDVFGVAGFVLPGDRVDVMHTHADTSQEGYKKSYTDVLLQYVRVLGIDQLADERSDRPAVVKAVTLEVDTESAQKLTLAGNIGSLSLALRPAGATNIASTDRVTGSSLGRSVEVPASAPDPAPAALPEPPPLSRGAQVTITRAVVRTDYEVPLQRR